MINFQTVSLFLLGLAGKITAKLMPVIIQDLIDLANFVFAAAKSEITSPQFQASALAIAKAVEKALATFWGKLNLKEQLALVLTPFILISIILLVTRLHG